jgi:hypothetical protein
VSTHLLVCLSLLLQYQSGVRAAQRSTLSQQPFRIDELEKIDHYQILGNLNRWIDILRSALLVPYLRQFWHHAPKQAFLRTLAAWPKSGELQVEHLSRPKVLRSTSR